MIDIDKRSDTIGEYKASESICQRNVPKKIMNAEEKNPYITSGGDVVDIIIKMQSQ
jgi:hypothetical protein